MFLNRFLLALPVALIFYTASALPVRAAKSADEIRQISLGERHACAVTQGGALLCWGNNESGQIGDGTLGDKQRNAAQAIRRNPTLVFASGATAVSAGYAHTCAVVNGALQCWGWNKLGQVNGKPSEQSVLKPALVIESGVTAVAAGGMHTCAVVRGAALCWGADGSPTGKSGNTGDTPFKSTQVIARGVTAIAARAQSSCAIVGGALLCWGDNRYGQISSPRSEGYVAPTQLIASGVTAVAIGGNDGTMCAVVAGALQCWGKKYDPASDPNGTAFVAKPTTVIAQGVTGVAVFGMSGCAVVQAGLQCWGYDSMGALGGGGGAPRIVPNPVSVIAEGVSAVGMGESYTCALVDGALRCRGYNGYGAISVSIALDKIADSRPFSKSEGDVRTLSHAAADAVAAKEGLPEKVARFLPGKLVAHDHAVYFVRRASAGYLGRGEGNEIVFHLDVTPLYPTKNAVGGDVARDTMIALDTPCGEGDLPARVDTVQLRVQKDNRFVGLADAFKTAFPELPEWAASGDNTPMRLSAPDMRRIESCAKAINDAWDSGPIKTISLGSSNGSIEIAPSLGRSWSVPGNGEHGADLAVHVELKPGRKTDLYVEAQSVSAMVCDAVMLSRWKRGLSSAWKLRGQLHEEIALGFFYTDEETVQAVDRPIFPAYTQDELRRAIHVEQSREGLASIAEAKACAPSIVGYRYTIRNASGIVQTVYNPGFSTVPERGCDKELPALALRVADQLGYVRGKRIHTAICKTWPGEAGKTIIALVREQDGATDEMGSYDLDVLVARTDSAEILQHVLQPGAISSDAMHFDGIALDTANYALSRGVRAFGLRTRHSHIGGTSSSDETLRLYVPQGKALKPVLPELTMRLSVSDRGGECNEASDTARTVSIGQPGRHGYADLVVTEQGSRQEVQIHEGRCTEVSSRSNRRYVLPFDGTQYVLPGNSQ